MGDTAADRIGVWVSALTYEDVPPHMVDKAALCLLDGLGCGLFGSTQPWTRIVADVAASNSAGGACTVLGQADGVGPLDAPLINGTAIHGFEIDDAHVLGLIHPGAVVIPAVLAVSEQEGASGARLLTGLIAGYEIGLRLGMAVGNSHARRGYHPTGTVGSVAAAAGAAAVLQLDADATRNALTVAATQAAGLYSARTGAMAKRFHAGRAAQSGVAAALLARRGFTGADEALDGEFGSFLSTMTDSPEPALLDVDLGDVWEIDQVGFKMYAACASSHTCIEAVERLAGRGVTASDLEELQVFMGEVAARNVGWPYEPGAVVAAQMNVAYAAAVQLLAGAAFVAQFGEPWLGDTDVLELTRRVSVVHDPTIDARGPEHRHAVRVVARLEDGTELTESVDHRWGSPANPVSSSDVREKFGRTAGAVLNEDTVQRLESAIIGIADAPDTTELSRLLRDLSGNLGAP